MKLLSKLSSIKNLSTISDLLILSVAIILGFYQAVLRDYSFIVFLSLCSCVVTALCISLYFKLYLWRNLVLSLKSFLLFFINYLQLLLYFWSFYLISFSLKNPIYKADLSIFSQYRYLLVSIITISVFLYILVRFTMLSPSSSYSQFMSKLNYPYLKEEIRLILQTWHKPLLSSICSMLIDKLSSSKTVLYFYFLTHFIIFYLPRIIISILFIKFVWLTGDLRYILYLSPVFFVLWILSFFDYYFHNFFQSHCNYIHQVMVVRQINPVKASFGAVKTSLDNMTFEMTAYAFEQGFVKTDLPVFIDEWHIAASLSVYFSWYHKFLFYINRILFFIQIINIFNLVYFFFIQTYITSYLSMLSIFRHGGRSAFAASSRPYATSAAERFTDKVVKARMYQETEGVQFGDHPPVIDRDQKNPDNPAEVRYYGQLTHSKGTSDNPSVPLHPTKDVKGQPRPQNIVPARRVEYYDENKFGKDIPGSKQYFATSPVRENLAKNTVREEPT